MNKLTRKNLEALEGPFGPKLLLALALVLSYEFGSEIELAATQGLRAEVVDASAQSWIRANALASLVVPRLCLHQQGAVLVVGKAEATIISPFKDLGRRLLKVRELLSRLVPKRPLLSSHHVHRTTLTRLETLCNHLVFPTSSHPPFLHQSLKPPHHSFHHKGHPSSFDGHYPNKV